MAINKVYVTKYKRRKQNVTDYGKRLKMLKSRKSRLVIRKSLTKIRLQIVNYEKEGDKTVFGMDSSALKKLGWKHSLKNVPAAYLAGLLFGKKMIEKKLDNTILDMGLQSKTKGSKIFAALKGVIDAGINVPAKEKLFPSEDRASGKHLKENIQKDFEKIKSKIIGEKSGGKNKK